MDASSKLPEVKEAVAQISELLKEHKYHNAIELCENGLKEFPNQPDMKVRLAFANHKLKNLPQAEKIYRELVEEHQQAIIYFNLACVLTDMKDKEEAIHFYRKAIELEPKYRSAHNNIANLLRDKGEITEAVEHFELVQKHYPDHINSINGLGSCYASLGEHEKAAEYFRKTTELNPDDFNAHTNLGIELLLMGQFEEGWKEYAWRFHRPDLKRTFKCPYWQGESLEGKRLLIHGEQGAGDVIQFLRFLPHIKTLGAEIVLECHKELYKLCYNQTGVDIVAAFATKTPKSDFQIPLLSLPEVLGVKQDSIPNQVPYLFIPEDKLTEWRGNIQTNKKLKIGLVWAGNPQHPNDFNRSCDLNQFYLFLKHHDIEYYSLQKGARLEQLEQLPDNINITNLDDKIYDYLDTAACIEQLDLVITVDTSVAHLAGALGKEVWVLIPYVPDWRWMLNSETSPWYPTMRLFRQDKIGDWAPVIPRIAHALEEKLNTL